jgi:hypothetical protein
MRRPKARMALVLLFGVVLTGCYKQGAVSPSENPDATGKVPPKETQAEPSPLASCFEIPVAVEPIPQTIANMSTIGALVVDAGFVGYGKAVWNTSDGHRPTWEELRSKAIVLERPLAFKDLDLIRGDAAALPSAVARGGTLGCDYMSFDSDPVLTEGSRYLSFLAPVTDSDGKDTGTIQLIEAWPIDANGVVSTRLEGAVDLTDVVAQIAAHPYAGVAGLK